VTRLRIERRRLPMPETPGGRIRRDPRAERLGIAPAAAAPAEAVGPSGRIRRDPRAARGAGRASASVAAERAAAPALPRIVIDDPACLILAVPDLEDGRLDGPDRDLLGAARLLADAAKGAVVVLAPAGIEGDFGAAGADRLLPAPLPAGYAPEARTAAVLAAIERLQPRHILFADTATAGGDLGRRVAAALGETPAVRVLRLSAEEAASRGNGGRSDFLRRPPRILLLAAEAVDPAADALWEARPLPALESSDHPARIADGGLAATDPNAVPLAEADFIVSAGNGVSDWPAFHLVAAALRAAEGGSRVVCDAGLLPRGRQVGASGTLVEPRCYLAFGIAGAPQHLQGIARCERVLAVNTDLHADMVKRADLAIIADAQAVMPALTRLARERLGQDRP
jgi:electron transfer flavoprotein alpha subunit